MSTYLPRCMNSSFAILTISFSGIGTSNMPQASAMNWQLHTTPNVIYNSSCNQHTAHRCATLSPATVRLTGPSPADLLPTATEKHVASTTAGTIYVEPSTNGGVVLYTQQMWRKNMRGLGVTCPFLCCGTSYRRGPRLSRLLVRTCLCTYHNVTFHTGT